MLTNRNAPTIEGRNKMETVLTTLDIALGVVGSVETVGDTDDLFWDTARKRLYVTGGEGFVDVLQGSDHLVRTARIRSGEGAPTSLFVPAQNRLYVAAPHRGAQIAQVLVYDVKD